MQVSSGARLDRLPISPFHWRILAIISAGAMVDSFSIYLAAGVLAALAGNGFSSLGQNAWFMSATFAGMFIGAALAGVIGDKLGRRVSYQVNLLIIAVTCAIAAVADNMTVLIAARLVMGLGLGAELVISAGTVSEFVPPSYRGRWSAMLALVIAIGLPLSTWVGYLVIPHAGWRWMFGIAGLAAIGVWSARKSLPESPRWLEAMGRNDEADAVLREIEAEVTATSGPLPTPAVAVSRWASNAPPKPALARLLVAILIIVTVNVTVYGFIAWLPTFLVQQGLTVTKSLAYTTAMTLGAIAGSAVAILLADRISRVRALMGSCGLIVAFSALFSQMTSPAASIASGFFMIGAVYFMISIGQFGFVPELFPTRYRLRAAGLASMAGRAAAIGTPFATIGLYKSFALLGVIASISTLLVAVIISVAALRVETSGVPLEEV